MTYEARVRESRAPVEAMIVLAQGIDELLARLEDQEITPDPWGEWPAAQAVPSAPLTQQPFSETPEGRAARITVIQERLAAATDGDSQRAIEAELRLAKDDGQPLAPAVPEGVRIDVDGDLVGFPMPDTGRRLERFAFCETYPLHTFLAKGNELLPVDFASAYCKGGPMWLYLYDRDAVMGMPEEWRRAFVEDIHLDSPAQAQEVARDILKDTSPGKLPTVSED